MGYSMAQSRFCALEVHTAKACGRNFVSESPLFRWSIIGLAFLFSSIAFSSQAFGQG
jgi:hypothetical protein